MSIHDQVKSFTVDVESSYETRKAAVAHLARETHQALEQFKRDHKKIAGELKRSLAANRARRTSQVQNMRARNNSDLKEMASTLRTSLASENKARIEAVHTLLGEFSLDHRQARTHLNHMAQKMAAKRAGKSARPQATEMVVPVKPAPVKPAAENASASKKNTGKKTAGKTR